MDTRLAPATEADEAQVWPLARALATSSVPRRDAFAESFREILRDPRQTIIVARESAEVVAYAHALAHRAFHANGLIGWVEELMVDEQARGHGLGAALMDEVERWASELGCVYLCLATRRAAGFYLHLGYEESAVYFKKQLSAPATPRR